MDCQEKLIVFFQNLILWIKINMLIAENENKFKKI